MCESGVEDLGDISEKEKQNLIMWYTKNVRIIEHLLNNFGNNYSYFTKDFFYRYTEYKQKDYDDGCQVGRLYQSISMICLPREIRYFLTHLDYLDYDIVNSHPTILFDYAEKKGLVVENLSDYIKNRESILTKVITDLGYLSKEYDITAVEARKIAKTTILSGFNKSLKTTIKTLECKKSPTLLGLYKELQLIRNNLWSDYSNGDMPEFSGYMNNKVLSSDGDQLKVPDDLEKIKVKLQSLYCQTQETYYVKGLAEYIKTDYKQYLDEKQILDSESLIGFTEKPIHMDIFNEISLIPMYDGLLVSCSDDDYLKRR